MNSLEELLLPGACSIARAPLVLEATFLVWISRVRLLSGSSPDLC